MDNFLDVYGDLTRQNVHRIKEIYTPDVHFIDPAHEIRGIDALLCYFERLYTNVTSVKFEFHHPVMDGATGYLQWSMRFSHPRLNRGGEILVPGASFLKFSDEGRAYYHRDYYDLGAMIYEHLPIVGAGIGAIRRRLGV